MPRDSAVRQARPVLFETHHLSSLCYFTCRAHFDRVQQVHASMNQMMRGFGGVGLYGDPFTPRVPSITHHPLDGNRQVRWAWAEGPGGRLDQGFAGIRCVGVEKRVFGVLSKNWRDLSCSPSAWKETGRLVRDSPRLWCYRRTPEWVAN